MKLDYVKQENGGEELECYVEGEHGHIDETRAHIRDQRPYKEAAGLSSHIGRLFSLTEYQPPRQ